MFHLSLWISLTQKIIHHPAAVWGQVHSPPRPFKWMFNKLGNGIAFEKASAENESLFPLMNMKL